ncbi:unnamed protein product [Rhodiola kirilowii]
MPKKKGKRGDKRKRELEEYAQKTKCSRMRELNAFSDTNNDDTVNKEVCINSIFQDDLLERILVYLPFISIIRAGLVCKKWREITTSKRFLWDASQTGSQKPWFFKFIDYSGSIPSRYAYDPVLQKWQRMDFLDMVREYMFCDSSDGLVCYMNFNEIHVCNPISREHKMLQEPPHVTRLFLRGYLMLVNIAVDRRAHNYNVSVLDCEVTDSIGKFSIQIYDSTTMKWATCHTEFLAGWRTGHTSVICNRVLYFLIVPTDADSHEHGLLAYDFSSNSSSHGTLINSLIPLPCSHIYGLMNLKAKLIMVGGIDGPQGEGSILGFSIWLLEGKDWQLISRITNNFFQHCGDSFDSSGADDLIYIHGNKVPRLLVFDMNLKQWKWCQKFPVKDVFNGFCFQPRLDMSPFSQQPRLEITSSKKFLWNASQTVSQKPWFFKFVDHSENKPNGYAYDPILDKWHGRDLLDMMKFDMFCDSSDGLVCFMNNDEIHVCNPITREHRMVLEPPGWTRLIEDGYPPLVNISVNRSTHNYNVSVLILSCQEVTGSCAELSVQIYDSATMNWATFWTEVLTGWIPGRKSVICNRVLYCLVHSASDSQKQGLIAYKFPSNSSSHGTLIKSLIPLPCSQIYGLMNLKENLILVGGIDSPWYRGLFGGFSIWILEGKDWQLVSRITSSFFQNYGDFFDSSGADDLIYIHGNYDPELVVFDMNSKQWKWCEKFPTKDVFNGFCLQPRLDISP